MSNFSAFLVSFSGVNSRCNLRDCGGVIIETDSGFIPNGQCVYDQLFIGLYGAFDEFVLCWHGDCWHMTVQWTSKQGHRWRWARQLVVFSANNCLLPSRKPLPTRIWWGCTGRMSRNHHNLYACLYGKQSAYKNASDSRANSLCDNRRGTWYHVKLFWESAAGRLIWWFCTISFAMSTKTAAQNSLYIILVSQITSIATTLFTKTVTGNFEWLWLVLMVAGESVAVL